jgi:Xaa-Pro dipeptidase
LSRRDLLKFSGVSALSAVLRPSPEERLPASLAALKPMTGGMEDVSVEEHRARIHRAQQLMGENGLDAIVLGPSTGLRYFTGTRWGLSERFFGAVIPSSGDPCWITPAFEKARAEQVVKIGSDIRPWEEDESPHVLVAQALRDRKADRVGIDEAMPFAFSDGISKALPAAHLASATPVTAGCRMIKDAHEIALIRRACEITIQAHRAVFSALKEGMTQDQVSQLSSQAHERLGIPGGSLVLFGPDAAYPHGTLKPRPLRAGDFVLIDGGGDLHGYMSDITRTGVFAAAPTDRQRRVWDTVRRAQEAAFAALKPGAACQSVDQAARSVIEGAGFGTGYRALTHRLGHGIGMDGHEWTYLVRRNETLLKAGMCFSNEPGIYIPGELGVRLEDIMSVTEDGADHMGRWAGTPEDPAVV